MVTSASRMSELSANADIWWTTPPIGPDVISATRLERPATRWSSGINEIIYERTADVLPSSDQRVKLPLLTRAGISGNQESFNPLQIVALGRELP
jgi:hypothetical protein